MDIVAARPVHWQGWRGFEASGRATVNATCRIAMRICQSSGADGVGRRLTLDADYDEAEDRFNVSGRAE